MDFLKDIVENVWVKRLFWTVIVVLFNLLIYRLVTRILASKEKKTSRILSTKKNKTLIRMFKSITATILSILTVLTVLQIFGVDVTSMLAGVGVVSIIVGFALQDSLKDIIRGFTIISDNYYEIGDVIKFGDNIGPVTSVSLLTTKIQDINTNNFISIANRNIDQVEVDPGYIYLAIPLPLDLKTAKSAEIMQEATQKIQKLDLVTSAAYQGINKVDSSAMTHQFVLTCDPVNKPSARRAALRVILTTLEDHKIPLPHEQLDIHDKK